MKRLAAAAVFSIISVTVIAGGSLGTQKIRNRAARPDIPGMLLIELGFNFLQDNDPVFDTHFLKSRTANILYFYDVRIGKSNFYFMPGVGVGLDKYAFENNITLERLPSKLIDTVNITEGNVKKSLLAANYVDLPLEVRFYANPSDRKRSFNAGVGVKLGYLFQAHTKVKVEKYGEMMKYKVNDDFELSRFRYGITGRVGVGGFNVFFYKNMTELFDKGEGPLQTEMSNMTFGFSFTGF